MSAQSYHARAPEFSLGSEPLKDGSPTSQAAAVAWQWPIRPSLRAAFSLGTGAAGDTQLALEITPRVVGANFTWLRLAAWRGGQTVWRC